MTEGLKSDDRANRYARAALQTETAAFRPPLDQGAEIGGAERDRTDDLLNAIPRLSRDMREYLFRINILVHLELSGSGWFAVVTRARCGFYRQLSGDYSRDFRTKKKRALVSLCIL
jgi:hypothetical protein